MRRILPVIVLAFLIFSVSSSIAADKVVVVPLMSGSGGCSNTIPTVESAGQVWMDRNLGAPKVAESYDDFRSYGWLYQWGRLSDGHQDRTSPTRSTLSTGDIPGHGDFITTDPDWRSSINNKLWQGISGINNPCPCGFRLPTAAEWKTEMDSWSSKDSAGAFASPLKLVIAGWRSNTSGTVNNSEGSGSYWCSTVNGSLAYYLDFYSSTASIVSSSDERSLGFSVRCIKD